MKVEILQKKNNLSSFKDEKMKRIEKVTKILEEQETQIKEQNDAVNQYTNVAKKVISEINFKNLKKVKRSPEVENLYRFFYATLYKEDEQTFDYDEFVKVALGS